MRCVYLTDGGSLTEPRRRDAESTAVLTSLGVDAAAIAFLTVGDGRVADRDLAHRAVEASTALDAWIERSGFVPHRWYVPAFEGGHPDHDAACTIVAVLAAKRGTLGEVWQFSLYNAYRCPRPFFNSLRQLPSSSRSRRSSLPFRRRLALSLLCWRYRSQRRSWIGLFPGAFVERVVLNRESVVRIDPGRIFGRPHAGDLLYERMWGFHYQDVSRSLLPLAERLPP